MTPRFTLTTLLAAMSFVAIWMGAFTVWASLTGNSGSWSDWQYQLFFVYGGCPLWCPFVFVAYALGRRSLNWKIVLAFLLVEIAGFAVLYAVKIGLLEL